MVANTCKTFGLYHFILKQFGIIIMPVISLHIKTVRYYNNASNILHLQENTLLLLGMVSSISLYGGNYVTLLID